jgi:hypothetical protein
MKYYEKLEKALQGLDTMVHIIGTVVSEDGVCVYIDTTVSAEEALQHLKDAMLSHEVYFVKGKGYGFFWDDMPEELSWGA